MLHPIACQPRLGVLGMSYRGLECVYSWTCISSQTSSPKNEITLWGLMDLEFLVVGKVLQIQ